MRRFVKSSVSFVLIMCMLMSVIGLQAFTVTAAESALEAQGSNEIEKSKTATPLDKNGFSDVTLTVGGSSDNIGSDIVFVIDKSQSDKFSSSLAKGMFEQLLEAQKKSGADIKIGVVIFNYTSHVALPLTKLTEENADTLLNSLPTYKSGTNIDAGLITAMEMLEEDKSVAANRKHVILISDGLTWAFNDENNVPSTILYKTPNNTYYTGTQAWISGRDGDGDYHVPKSFASFDAYWAQVKKWVEADKDKYSFSIVGYSDKTVDYTNASKVALSYEESQKHAQCMDRALYDAWESYTALQNAGYNCYAYDTGTQKDSIGNYLIKMLNGKTHSIFG